MSTPKVPKPSTRDWIGGLEQRMTPEHRALRDQTKAAATATGKKPVTREAFLRQQELFRAARAARH